MTPDDAVAAAEAASVELDKDHDVVVAANEAAELNTAFAEDSEVAAHLGALAESDRIRDAKEQSLAVLAVQVEKSKKRTEQDKDCGENLERPTDDPMTE